MCVPPPRWRRPAVGFLPSSRAYSLPGSGHSAPTQKLVPTALQRWLRGASSRGGHLEGPPLAAHGPLHPIFPWVPTASTHVDLGGGCCQLGCSARCSGPCPRPGCMGISEKVHRSAHQPPPPEAPRGCGRASWGQAGRGPRRWAEGAEALCRRLSLAGLWPGPP